MSVDFGTSSSAAQAARACVGVIAYGSIARRASACGEAAKLLYLARLNALSRVMQGHRVVAVVEGPLQLSE